MEYWLVLVAALFHAIWNGMIKNSQDKLMALTMVRVVGIVFGGSLVLTQPALEFQFFGLVIAASIVHFIYFYCLINAYKHGDFSQVYPISRGLAPLLVLVVGLVALGDTLSQQEFLGTLFISFGVLALAVVSGKPASKPLLFALATASCIATYTIISGIAVRQSNSIWSYIGWLELITGVVVVVFSRVRRGRAMVEHVKANLPLGIMAGVLSTSAFIVSLWAISRVPMAPIAALRETSIIFAVLIGAFFLKEGFSKGRLLASVLVVSGIGLLVLP